MKKISFILIAVFFTITLTSCQTRTVCEHEYATAFASTCKKCGEVRVADTSDFAATIGDNGDTNDNNDNGDTKDNNDGCSICGGVDDGDCSTPVLCSRCSTVLIEAKSHDFSGDWNNDAEGHWHSCTNEKCKVTDVKEPHVLLSRSIGSTDGACAVCDHALNTVDESDETPLGESQD